jgi:hypothetical protein
MLGTTIEGLSLKDENSVKKALDAVDPNYRFAQFSFQNDTHDFTAVLVLFQGLDETGEPLLPGYVKDTGVTVGGVNVLPHSAQTTNIQNGINCLATRVKISAHVKDDRTGKERDITFPDQLASANGYIRVCNERMGQHGADVKKSEPDLVLFASRKEAKKN